ncbi:MAG: ATP-binding cassette domain-containing protein, partial [Acidobacteria bacterium]|nr:ATP-binding cassette domain-containing protein [Acidobacteriota bacterium]
MKFLDPRLFRYSRSSRGFISVVVALALLTTLLTLLQAFTITSVVVDAFQKEKSWVNLQPQIRNLAFIFGLRALIAFFGDSLTRKIGAKIRVELRTQLFNQALSQGTELNLKFGYGKLSLIATRGIAALEPYFNKFMPQLFIALIVPFIVGVTITLKDLASGLIILGTIPLIPIFGILIGKYTSEAMAKKWRTMGILSSYVVDLFAGLLTLKVYGRSKHQKNRIKEVGNQYRVETMKVLKISFLSSLVLELIATLSVALIAVWIGLRLVSGNISLSDGLLVLLLAPEVYWPIRQVSAQFHASAEGLESSREIFEVLEMKPQSKGHRNTLNRLREIRWDSLIIEYPNRAPIQIPRGSAKSGEITLLVGQSGSGKTSLINTLMGLVNPIKGKVWINNINSAYPLHEFDNDFWLSQISWVSQTPHFPHGTIAEIF